MIFLHHSIVPEWNDGFDARALRKSGDFSYNLRANIAWEAPIRPAATVCFAAISAVTGNRVGLLYPRPDIHPAEPFHAFPILDYLWKPWPHGG